MKQVQFSSELSELTFDAVLRTYHRKTSFVRFLSLMGIKDTALAWRSSAETKRELLERIYPKLLKSDAGKTVIVRMALDLYGRADFPDLAGFEESETMLEKAKVAIAKLSDCINRQNEKLVSESEKKRIRDEALLRAEKIREERSSLNLLETRLTELTKRLGEQQAGYDFEDWFYDLMEFCEVQHRKPYKANGRQIDGSISINGTDYLVELKFQNSQSCSTDVDSIVSKLRSKADNTLSLLISMSGFSSTAISEARQGRTLVILLDYNHIYLVLRGTINFQELIERLKRHAAQTGESYLPTDKIF